MAAETWMTSGLHAAFDDNVLAKRALQQMLTRIQRICSSGCAGQAAQKNFTTLFSTTIRLCHRVMSSLQLVSHGCAELADAQVAAAAVLDARLAMAPRLVTAIQTCVQGAATLLAVASDCATNMRGDAAATFTYACATLTDVVEEACANAAQLTHAAALCKTDTRFNFDALRLADGLAFNTPAHAVRGEHIALIAYNDHIASVHVLVPYEVLFIKMNRGRRPHCHYVTIQ